MSMVCGMCRDCRHWEGNRDAVDHTGTCARTVTINADPAASAVGSMALATDGEGYYGALITEPNFGCVQFQPEEA